MDKQEIFLNNRHIESSDEKVLQWKESVKTIIDNKTPSTIDNLKKTYYKSKKLLSLKKYDQDFQFLLVKKLLIGNLYNIHYLEETTDLEEDYFTLKSKEQLMKVSWKKDKNVSIEVVNEKRYITSSIKRRFFGNGWKYQVHFVSKEPITYLTLKASMEKINLIRETSINLKKIAKKLNLTIKYISKLSREDILKLDFNNINYGKD